MLNALLHPLIINLFWFSLPVIGCALLLFFRNQQSWKYISKGAGYILSQHIFLIVLAGFALTTLALSVLCVPLYIFQLPVAVPVVAYLLLLSVSVVYLLFRGAKVLFSTKSIDVFRFKNQTLLVKVLFLGACALLVGDFLLTVFVAKAFPWGDGVFHMARVVNILNEGFNIQSSFFSNLPEGGYLWNVMYVLYSIPAKLFGLEPMKVWEYSLGFFRLMSWMSIFVVGSELFRRWLGERSHWLLFSTIGMVSAVCIYSSQLFVANYPSRLAMIWMILLFICLAVYRKSTAKYVSVAAILLSVIVTMTHTTYALITACFVAFVFLVRAVVTKKIIPDRFGVLTYVVPTIVLLVGPLVAKLMPVRTSNRLIEIVDIPTIDVFGMHILAPKWPSDIVGWIVLTTSILVFVFMAIMLIKRATKQQAIIFIASLVFFPLIVFTPPVFTLLNAILPTWLIERFSAVSFFSFLTVAMAGYLAYTLAKRRFSKIKSSTIRRNTERGVVIGMVGLTLGYSLSMALPTYRLLVKDWRDKPPIYLEFAELARDFKPIMTNNSVVVSSPTASYYLNAVLDIDILATEYGHSPLAADGENRSLCQEEIMKTINYNDLKSIGADFVALSPYEDMKDVRSLAEEKPYLTRVAENQYYIVYKVDHSADYTGAPYRPCVLFKENEEK